VGVGELPKHLPVSLGRVVTGLAIGIAVGTTLALISGLSRRGEDLLDATLQMPRTLPFLCSSFGSVSARHPRSRWWL
jgi:sulfonate transport system permease protein